MQLRTPLGCADLNRAEGKGSQQRSTGTAGRRCVWGHRRAAPFISARWDEKPRAECLTWGWGAVWTRLSPTAARGGLPEVGTRWDLWVAAPRSAAPRPVAPSPAPSAAPRGRKARTGRAGRARNDGVGREGPARPRGLAPRPPRAAAPGWAMGEVCVCMGGLVRIPAAVRRPPGRGGAPPPHAGGDVSADAAPPPQPPAGSAVTRGAAAAAAPPRSGGYGGGGGGGDRGAKRGGGSAARPGPTRRPSDGEGPAPARCPRPSLPLCP